LGGANGLRNGSIPVDAGVAPSVGDELFSAFDSAAIDTAGVMDVAANGWTPDRSATLLTSGLEHPQISNVYVRTTMVHILAGIAILAKRHFTPCD
jgi:hypothetical protein